MTVLSRCAARHAVGLAGGASGRATRQYVEAVSGLTDTRLSRRVGALHTLALLGNDSPPHRAPIVDVICALLRMSGQDAATRDTASRVLRERLHPAGAEFWPGMSVDLSGAVLADLDLSHCRVDGSLRLDGCTFLGQARLRGLTVGGFAVIRGAQFTDHAWLERASFRGPVWFDGTAFAGDAWFGETAFSAYASFAGVDFCGHAWFGSASFAASVDFGHAIFRRSAGFRGAVAQAAVSLASTTFHGPARVSRRDVGWNIIAPGWEVVVDDDNSAVGRLFWVGGRDLIERPVLATGITPS